MKYVPVDKLIAEIERLKDEYTDIAIDSHYGTVNANSVVDDLEQLLSLIASLQQEQPELPRIGYAETHYQRGLHDGIIKGQVEILNVLEEVEKRKAEPVLFIKEQEQSEADLDGKSL